MASTTESAGAKGPVNELTILTYNVGLLRFKFMGCCTLFSNPPYASERLPYIPEALKGSNADIISLQECYEDCHARFIINSLKADYPYHARVTSGGILKFHNGLLFLSKYPIESFFLQSLNKVAALERYLATKSNLAVRVNIPGVGKVTFVNMHTTAGGTTDPEHPASDLDRQDELRQAVEICTNAMRKNTTNSSSNPLTSSGSGDAAAKSDANAREVGIIIGDLNCGPEASADNYQYVLGQGFRDTYLEAREAGRLVEGSPEFTWDPKNYLNEIGPHAACPGQRCDHLLLPREPSAGMDAWEVASAAVVFHEKKVAVGKGVTSTLSDHHGLLTTLRRK